MRTLLFVQTGDGRPKCAGVAADSVERIRGSAFYELRPDGLFGRRVYVGSRAGRAKARADRWWLVECPDAATGRMIIGDCPIDDPRILASGGRP